MRATKNDGQEWTTFILILAETQKEEKKKGKKQNKRAINKVE